MVSSVKVLRFLRFLDEIERSLKDLFEGSLNEGSLKDLQFLCFMIHCKASTQLSTCEVGPGETRTVTTCRVHNEAPRLARGLARAAAQDHKLCKSEAVGEDTLRTSFDTF